MEIGKIIFLAFFWLIIGVFKLTELLLKALVATIEMRQQKLAKGENNEQNYQFKWEAESDKGAQGVESPNYRIEGQLSTLQVWRGVQH